MPVRPICLSLFFLAILFLGHAVANDDFETAQKLYDAGDFKSAGKLLKKITKENPKFTDAWFYLGNCYRELDKEEKSIEAYQKALHLDAENVEIRFNLGVAYYKAKSYSKAIDAFKTIIRLQPDHAQAHFWLGLSYDRIARISDAFAQYKLLKSIDKELAEKLYGIIFLQ